MRRPRCKITANFRSVNLVGAACNFEVSAAYCEALTLKEHQDFRSEDSQCESDQGFEFPGFRSGESGPVIHLRRNHIFRLLRSNCTPVDLLQPLPEFDGEHDVDYWIEEA